MLTVAETAGRLGVSLSRVHQWIRGGRLKASRFGPRLYAIAEVDVEAFAALARQPGRPKMEKMNDGH